MTTNDAAERLHLLIEKWVSPSIVRSMHAAVDAALDVEAAAERRATVEEILRGLRSEEQTVQVRAIIASVSAILDDEAAR